MGTPLTAQEIKIRTRWVIKDITASVESYWGKYARDRLGDTLYEALLNSALLMRLDGQDDEVDPETIRLIMRTGRAAIIDLIYGED